MHFEIGRWGLYERDRIVVYFRFLKWEIECVALDGLIVAREQLCC